jgi:hypothetical protein
MYKKAVIDNQDNLDLKTFEVWVQSHLIDNLWFNPLNYELPQLEFPGYYCELDHDWCELIERRSKGS